MARAGFDTALQDLEGNAVNGATVTVYDVDTGTPSTIYRKDGSTSLSNPFLTGYEYSTGEIIFTADNGQYDIKIVNGAETRWIENITIIDGSSLVSDTDLATTTTAGIVEKATTAEMTAGTADKYPDAAETKTYVDGQINALTFLQDQRAVIDFASDANYTLSAAENNYSQIEMTDTGVVLTTTREIVIDTAAKIFSFINSTAQTLSVKTASGTAATVYADGFVYDLYSDGTDVVILEKNIPDSLNDTLYATTSGTSKDFTIPYWATKVTVMLSGFSLSGTGVPIIQLGTGGSPETTGYLGTVGNRSAESAHSSSFLLRSGTGVATETWEIQLNITLMDQSTNKWSMFGVSSLSNTANIWMVSGTKALSGTLDLIRLTSSTGTDTFDAGSVNLRYE